VDEWKVRSDPLTPVDERRRIRRMACDPWGVRVLVALLATVALATSCSGGEKPTLTSTTTTFADLFGDAATTSTLAPAKVSDWETVQLVKVRKDAEACIEGARPEAIVLPDEGPRTVTVESGDTLGVIADRFDTTVEAFMRANSLSNPDRLRVGQVLIVPRERPDEVEGPEGPEVEWEELACVLDTGVAAHGPDGLPVGAPGRIEVVVRWPRIDGPDEAPRVNGRLLGLLQGAVAKFLDDVITAVERNGYACREALDGRCMWLLHEYEVLLSTDEVFSVRNTTRRLLPGSTAESTEVLTETFDLVTGRPFTVDLLFEPETDWVGAVSAEAVTRLENEPWVDERRHEGAGPEAANFERFNLTHGGLVLSFAPFTIGGSGSNTVSITIPYRSLEGYWAADGPVTPLLAELD
jgi:LysM repeat protein